MSSPSTTITTKQHIIHKRNYPEQLRQIHNSPDKLYVRGNLPKASVWIAIVGTRKPTEYGKSQAYKLAFELAQQGITIVSGLAYGIDGIAHQAAIDAGGTTVAVLGSGIDVCYPSAHRKLGQDIVACGGAIVSEYEDGVPPLRHHFPARNRIIAGLSQALVIPEADARSGSLITALIALEENRLVMAVPGDVTRPRSAGPNNLIRAGALPILRVEDIWVGLGLEPPTTAVGPQPVAMSDDELEIIRYLEQGVETSDSLSLRMKKPIPRVIAALGVLELSGIIMPIGQGYWMKRP
ncbi:MAG: DNA-processing protein DprA [bacterium]